MAFAVHPLHNRNPEAGRGLEKCSLRWHSIVSEGTWHLVSGTKAKTKSHAMTQLAAMRSNTPDSESAAWKQRRQQQHEDRDEDDGDENESDGDGDGDGDSGGGG
eukprot:3175081-Rhodomonas_salina.2